MSRFRLAAALVAVLLLGCSQRSEAPAGGFIPQNGPIGMTAKSAPGAVPKDRGLSVDAAAPEPTMQEEAKQDEAPEPAKPAAPAQERYLVRKASLTLEVKGLAQGLADLRAMVRNLGGYVGDENVQTSAGEVPSATVTVRVPSRRLDDLLGKASGLGTVHARQVTAEDVTGEVVDTEARLRNLKREEAQYLSVLTQAHSVRDILQVERELSRVRGEIESTTARFKALSNLVELATLTITLSERVQSVASSPWDLGPVMQNAFQQAQNELAGGVGNLVSALIRLFVVVLPLAVPVLGLFALVGWVLGKALIGRWPGWSASRFWVGWGLVGLLGLTAIWPMALLLAIAGAVWAGIAWRRPAVKEKVIA